MTIAMISSIAAVVALAFAYILLKKRKQSRMGIDERAAVTEMLDRH
jgi:hypothetical protein